MRCGGVSEVPALPLNAALAPANTTSTSSMARSSISKSYAAALRSQPLRGVMQSAAPDAGRQLREDPDQPLPQLGIELAQCVQVAVGTLAINERAEAAFHQDRPANLKRGLKPS